MRFHSDQKHRCFCWCHFSELPTIVAFPPSPIHDFTAFSSTCFAQVKSMDRSLSQGLWIQNRVWPQISSKVATAQRHSFCKFQSHAHTYVSLSLIFWYPQHTPNSYGKIKCYSRFYWLMFAFITRKNNLVPLLEGLCSSNRFELSVFWVFCRNRTDDLRINSPALWPTELVLHLLG